jgi:hypothetical protein
MGIDNNELLRGHPQLTRPVRLALKPRLAHLDRGLLVRCRHHLLYAASSGRRPLGATALATKEEPALDLAACCFQRIICGGVLGV